MKLSLILFTVPLALGAQMQSPQPRSTAVSRPFPMRPIPPEETEKYLKYVGILEPALPAAAANPRPRRQYKVTESGEYDGEDEFETEEVEEYNPYLISPEIRGYEYHQHYIQPHDHRQHPPQYITYKTEALVDPHDWHYDWHKLSIIFLLKLALAKLKAFGLLKIAFLLMLKFKLFLLACVVKFALFVKAMKFLKALLIPLILLLLAPLLLLVPLLLLPLLLPTLAPLLGSLANPPTRSPSSTAVTGVNKLNVNARIDDSVEDHWHLLNHTGEECIERIACKLAAKNSVSAWAPFINWYLNKLKDVIPSDHLRTYAAAYLASSHRYEKLGASEEPTEKWCFLQYKCPENPSTTLKNAKKIKKNAENWTEIHTKTPEHV